jgi:hypothetical protein
VSSPEEIWRDFGSDENRVSVRSDNKARVYFSQIRRALAGLQHSVEDGASITNAERLAVERFIGVLQQTFEILALRHFYADTGPELKIDASDSGFAHFSMLLELAADLERRDELILELASVDELKRQMLDQIVEHGIHPRRLQVALMRRLYLEALAPEKLFGPFLPGKLEKVGKPEDDASYFWSFATYDRALNRPFVYLIYFSYDSEKGALREDSEAFAEIRSVARHGAGGRINLLGFSNRLDEQVVRMRPRIVKRLVLGPYLAPNFTNTDGDFGHLLESLGERLPFALHWETETLISARETRVGAGWLSKGRLRQVFWIPKDLDLSARGVSQVERCVLLPHWLAQQVEAAGLLTDHRCLAIEVGGDRE